MILTRFAYFEDRTIGQLKYKGFTCYTVERPWLANKPSESCIPEGEYLLGRYDSPRFGDRTWEVLGAPGRTFIAIHAANYSNQVEGCIAPGMGVFRDLSGVERSREACRELYRLTEDKDQMLIRIVRGEIWE